MVLSVYDIGSVAFWAPMPKATIEFVYGIRFFAESVDLVSFVICGQFLLTTIQGMFDVNTIWHVVQPHYWCFAEAICFSIFWNDSNGFLRHVVWSVNRHTHRSDCYVTKWGNVFQLNEVFSKFHYTSSKDVNVWSAIFEDFFFEVKDVVLSHTFLVPFHNFGSFIWFHLVVTIVFLTGYGSNVVFVALLIEIMWKIPFL